MTAFLPSRALLPPVSSLEAAVAQTLDRSAWEEKLSKAKGACTGQSAGQLKRPSARSAAQRPRTFTAEDRALLESGGLLKASLGPVPPGGSQVTLPNYYHPELKPITIDLDPSLPPQANVEEAFSPLREAEGRENREIARRLPSLCRSLNISSL